MIVGRQSGREPLCIVDEDVANPVHALDEVDVDAVDAVHRLQKRRFSLPYEAVGAIQVAGGRLRRGEAGYRLDQLVELSVQDINAAVGHGKYVSCLSIEDQGRL